MTATTNERMTQCYGLVPAMGSYGQVTDTLILAGTLVALDSDGRATPYVQTTDGSASDNVVGVAKAMFDNRATAPEGGADDALTCEVAFGQYDFGYTGTAPTPGTSVMWGVDNQTVSISSTTTVGGGTRGIVGYCIAVDTAAGTCRVLLGPAITAQIVIAASEASQLDTAQGDITDLETAVGTYGGGEDISTDLAAVVAEVGDYASTGEEADVATGLLAVEADLLSAACEVPIPLGSLKWNTGAAIAAFVDNTTDGYTASSTECFGIRFNDSTAPRLVAQGSVDIPADADDTAAVVLHAKGFRVGSADAAMVLTVTAFAQPTGAEYDADEDAGGSTTAFDGATKVVTDETKSFAAGVLPAGSTVSFSVTPDAALDGDDFVLTGLRLVYTRALRAA